MTFQRGCSHGFQPLKCGVEGCPHKDTRPRVQQLFGRNSNSQLAAKIFRESPDKYKALRQEGMALGLLPMERIPRCLQDDPE